MKMRRFLILTIVALIWSAACLPEDWDTVLFERKPSYDPFYVAYIDRVNSQALTFRIPASEDNEAWARARSVLKKFHRKLECSRKLTLQTAEVIEATPSKQAAVDYVGAAFLYQIRRVPLGETTEYSVAYARPSRYNTTKALRIPRAMANARIIAYYVIYGTIYAKAFDDGRLL